MSEPQPATLSDLAIEVRSKNAGPFWMTIEAFMRDEGGYASAARLITATLIADLYAVRANDVQVFHLPDLNVVKVSFPRPVSQASLHDRDVHAGQQHVPLARTRVTQGH